jgi:hypothetical protein
MVLFISVGAHNMLFGSGNSNSITLILSQCSENSYICSSSALSCRHFKTTERKLRNWKCNYATDVIDSSLSIWICWSKSTRGDNVDSKSRVLVIYKDCWMSKGSETFYWHFQIIKDYRLYFLFYWEYAFNPVDTMGIDSLYKRHELWEYNLILSLIKL